MSTITRADLQTVPISTPEHVEFFVPGVPAGQPRQRHAIRWGKSKKKGAKKGALEPFIANYDPGTADGWKNRVWLEACRLRSDPRFAAPHDGPCKINLVFLFPRTQRLLRRRVPDHRLPMLVTPDRDNLDKAVLDTLVEARLIADDRLVYGGELVKLYVARAGDEPGCRIEMWLFPKESWR